MCFSTLKIEKRNKYFNVITWYLQHYLCIGLFILPPFVKIDYLFNTLYFFYIKSFASTTILPIVLTCMNCRTQSAPCSRRNVWRVWTPRADNLYPLPLELVAKNTPGDVPSPIVNYTFIILVDYYKIKFPSYPGEQGMQSEVIFETLCSPFFAEFVHYVVNINIIYI